MIKSEARRTICTDIARVLHWTMPRVTNALALLDARLTPTGQAVQHVAPGRYALAARGRVVSADELARLRRTTRPFAAEDAALLRRLITGFEIGGGWTSTPTNEPASRASQNTASSNATASA